MTGEMAVLSAEGDIKTVWDSANAAEVEVARKQFDELRKKGFLAFKAKKDGGKGEMITAFDPDAERMILCPPVVGG